MVELQRLALRPRNKLQITVISHSPVILESVPDGDARAVGGDVAVASAWYDRVIRPLYLPGDGPPDEWVYTVLEADPARCAVDLGAPWLPCRSGDASALTIRPTSLQTSPPFAALADHLQRKPADIPRRVVLLASNNELAKVFADGLVQAFGDWHSRTTA